MRTLKWCVICGVLALSGVLIGCGSGEGTDPGPDPDPMCGDGMVDDGEECDDGEDNNSDTVADACRTDCSDPVCGDGVADSGEDCDSLGAETADCNEDCTAAECGDGIINEAADEDCDDGNTDAEDGCDAQCAIEEGYICDGEPSVCAICGDGIVSEDAGEDCDEGEAEDWGDCAKPDSAPEKACKWIPTAFKFLRIGIESPYLEEQPAACQGSATALLLGGGISDSMDNDAAVAGEPDCLSDVNFIITMSPLSTVDEGRVGGSFTIGDCTQTRNASCGGVTLNPTPCRPALGQDDPVTELDFRVERDGTCLEVLEDTFLEDETLLTEIPGNWPVTSGERGCVVSDPVDSLTIALGSAIKIPLKQVAVAARFGPGEVPNRLNTGMIRGFLREADASKIVLSTAISLFLNTQVLTDYLPNQCGDGDIGPNDEPGYWFYFSFRAKEVPWEGGLLCGNGIVDEGETCDPGIATGEEGACDELIACEDDGDVCTTAVVAAGDPCNPVGCRNITVLFPDDGSDECCPNLAEKTKAEDPNCPNYNPDLRPDLQ